MGGYRDIAYLVGTGYGRNEVPFANKNISEISCHAMGTFSCNPLIKTIVDIGGQDVKAIALDGDGSVLEFAMNDKCAAGTGQFLRGHEQDIPHGPGTVLGSFAQGQEDHTGHGPVQRLCRERGDQPPGQKESAGGDRCRHPDGRVQALLHPAQAHRHASTGDGHRGLRQEPGSSSGRWPKSSTWT
ncbi:MAG: hypothetical protein MZV70_39185 [Desulfobacterales bacterium]|nr:hypothetical protein [Desulfobacterales bacterium]